MTHLLYLAAGQSRRYGKNKLLDLWNGKPLYRHGLDVIRQAIQSRKDCTLTVVTCWPEIAQSMKADGIPVVSCPDSYMGVSHTIKAGIRSLEPLAETDYLCFCVADQPNLTSAAITRLLDAAEQKPATACLTDGAVSGNPVLFSAELAEELKALEGDKGGKSVMRKHPENHMEIRCDAKELMDVDYQKTTEGETI